MRVHSRSSSLRRGDHSYPAGVNPLAKLDPTSFYIPTRTRFPNWRITDGTNHFWKRINDESSSWEVNPRRPDSTQLASESNVSGTMMILELGLLIRAPDPRDRRLASGTYQPGPLRCGCRAACRRSKCVVAGGRRVRGTIPEPVGQRSRMRRSTDQLAGLRAIQCGPTFALTSCNR
jgi:hypothetical protein